VLLAEREVFEDQLVMSAAGQRPRANQDGKLIAISWVLAPLEPKPARRAGKRRRAPDAR